MKSEFVGEYIHGMGNNFYLIRARSQEEVASRYRLLIVKAAEQSGLAPERLEMMRMYPGPGRPLDLAVQDLSESAREEFILAALRQREEAHDRRIQAKLPIPDREPQYWVDIDDDESFRKQMHDLWKDDPRYRELPPEKRLA